MERSKRTFAAVRQMSRMGSKQQFAAKFTNDHPWHKPDQLLHARQVPLSGELPTCAARRQLFPDLRQLDHA